MASEVFITRRGGGSAWSTSGITMVAQYITFNMNWVVPYDAKDNRFKVTIIGSGSNNGPSGFFNNGTYTLTPGAKIAITVGASPALFDHNAPAKTTATAFGTYISAAGGGITGGAAGGTIFVTSSSTSYEGYCKGWTFGGGSVMLAGSIGCTNGGDGGPYGGGGGCTGCVGATSHYGLYVNGGKGGTYGGGGGGFYININSNLDNSQFGNGGNGGTYGGGGGGWYCGRNTSANGGNGYNIYSSTAAKAGIDTSSLTTVDKDGITGAYLRGKGLAGGTYGGGGGYGGNGGNGGTYTQTAIPNHIVWCCGGGGGYGSRGGNGVNLSSVFSGYSGTGVSISSYPSGGGGGGYGGNGGNGSSARAPTVHHCGGGGGGYGIYSSGGNYGGGGGYYCPAGGVNFPGGSGGGGIGIWEGTTLKASFGSGSSLTTIDVLTSGSAMYEYLTIPEPGICIIQYTPK